MRRSMAEGRVDRLFVFVAPETRNAEGWIDEVLFNRRVGA